MVHVQNIVHAKLRADKGSSQHHHKIVVVLHNHSELEENVGSKTNWSIIKGVTDTGKTADSSSGILPFLSSCSILVKQNQRANNRKGCLLVRQVVFILLSFHPS